MELNRIVFPAPKPSYTTDHRHLYWVPKNQNNTKHIPVFFIKGPVFFKHLLIFFHGNAEDIGIASNFADLTGQCLEAHVVLVEYPSYGVYKGDSPTEKTILEDSQIVYDWAVNQLNFSPKNVYVTGRSIGSGPATFLASTRQIKMLILLSPYMSLQDIAKDHFSFFGYMLKNRFNNIERIKEVHFPVFILHGMKVCL